MELPSALSETLIKRGAIFHSNADRFRKKIGHSKFFVVMGVSQGRVVGFFFINSNIHHMVESKPALFALQYGIKASDYPFLRHSSFIGCASLQEWAYDDLLNSIKKGETEYKATLHETHIEEILEQVRQSEVFSEEEIESYFGE